MFAKLYERDGKQVLVTAEANDDDEPIIKVTAIPDGLGVCTVSIEFEKYDTRDKAFADVVDEDWAFGVYNDTLNSM